MEEVRRFTLDLRIRGEQLEAPILEGFSLEHPGPCAGRDEGCGQDGGQDQQGRHRHPDFISRGQRFHFQPSENAVQPQIKSHWAKLGARASELTCGLAQKSIAPAA